MKWGIDELDILIKEISKYHRNIVLIKDLEIDEMNKIFRNKFNTFDFETNRFYKNPGIVSFFDNIEGENLYNAIKFAKKIIATHGTMTSLAFLCKKPCLDLFQCEINNIDDYHRYKNSFYEFKPNYPGYDFIIPSKNIYKTIKKMQFSLSKK